MVNTGLPLPHFILKVNPTIREVTGVQYIDPYIYTHPPKLALILLPVPRLATVGLHHGLIHLNLP